MPPTDSRKLPRKLQDLKVLRANENLKRPRGAPVGNKNGMKHGVYVNQFLTPEEEPLFKQIVTRLCRDFVFNKSSDYMQVELVAVYFLRLGRAQALGDWDTSERIDRMIRSHLRELKATKLSRETAEPKKSTKTTAEWATELLEKARREGEGATEDGASTEGEEASDGEAEPASSPEVDDVADLDRINAEETSDK